LKARRHRVVYAPHRCGEDGIPFRVAFCFLREGKHEPEILIVLGKATVAIGTARNRPQILRMWLREKVLRGDMIRCDRFRLSAVGADPLADARVLAQCSVPASAALIASKFGQQDLPHKPAPAYAGGR